MAGRLNPRPAAALAGLTLLVLVAHLGLLGGARQLLRAWAPETPEPERLQAVFLRPLQPAAPPPPTTAPPTGSEGQPGTNPAKIKPQLGATPGQGLKPLATAGDLASETPPAVEALAAPEALELPETPGAYSPGVEWPLSTELRYQLTGFYRGPVYGQATVQWLREGAHYQVHLESSIGPSVAPLLTRRLSSDGTITPQGLTPRRFDEVSGGLAGGNSKKTLIFDDGGVILANGQRSPREDMTQDAASQFVQLTWLFLTGRQTAQPGWLVQLPLALPRRVHLWRYVVRGGLAPVDTPMGPIQAWHVDSDMLDTWGDMQTEIWLAPSLQYLPVRIRIWPDRVRDSKTFIELSLKEAPLQAMAPAAAASPPPTSTASSPASSTASSPTSAPAPGPAPASTAAPAS